MELKRNCETDTWENINATKFSDRGSRVTLCNVFEINIWYQPKLLFCQQMLKSEITIGCPKKSSSHFIFYHIFKITLLINLQYFCQLKIRKTDICYLFIYLLIFLVSFCFSDMTVTLICCYNFLKYNQWHVWVFLIHQMTPLYFHNISARLSELNIP